MKKLIETYTVEEVAKVLQLHPYTVRRLSREGKVPATKIGGQWRYCKGKIEGLVKKEHGKTD